MSPTLRSLVFRPGQNENKAAFRPRPRERCRQRTAQRAVQAPPRKEEIPGPGFAWPDRGISDVAQAGEDPPGPTCGSDRGSVCPG